MGIHFDCSQLQAKDAFLESGCKLFSEIKVDTETSKLIERRVAKLYRIMGAYQILSEPEDLANYMQTVRIRSMLNQQLSTYRDDRGDYHYPFMLFAIKEKDLHIMLEIDFIRRAIIFRNKDHDRTEYSFRQIMCVLQGKEHDQFIVEFNIK